MIDCIVFFILMQLLTIKVLSSGANPGGGYHMIYIHSQTCLNGHLYKKQRFIKTTFPSSLEWTLYTGFTVFDIRIVEELCLFMIMTRGGSRISI
jgi:hypothetical protein